MIVKYNTSIDRWEVHQEGNCLGSFVRMKDAVKWVVNFDPELDSNNYEFDIILNKDGEEVGRWKM